MRVHIQFYRTPKGPDGDIMKLKLLVAAIVIMFVLSAVPNVLADTTISDVTYTPSFPKQSDTIHVKAKIVATENITTVRLLNCWEKPTYTCGFPKDMTDADKDGYYEANISNSAWTNGNVVHLNISATVKSGAEKAYVIPPITIGTASGPGDYPTKTDCEKAGYFWWDLDSYCHDKAIQPSDFKNRTECETAGHFWWDSKCNAEKGTPDKYTDKASCTNVSIGYYWYANKCNKEDQPPDGKKFIPALEAGLVFSAVAIAGLALLGTRIRKKK